MKSLPLILILFGSILEIIDGTLSFFSEQLFSDGIIPSYLTLPSLSIQVFLFLLAIYFSIINLIADKQNKIVHFSTILSGTALFLGRLTWFLNDIKWTFFS